MRKKKIPMSLRQMVWITYNDENFRAKCHVAWCKNTITPFTFEVGHNKPESKGGTTTIENLLPICPSCNRSMGNKYTIQEYSERYMQLRKTNIIPVSSPIIPPIITRHHLLQRIRNAFRCFGIR